MSDQPKSARDVLIDQQIERHLAPYVGVAPPELLATMREGLEDTLRTLPTAVAIIDQLVAEAAPLRTEENSLEGDAGVASDEAGGTESS
jgi:hypothetical protein